MNLRSVKNFHWLLLITVIILLVVMSFLSEGFYGGADNLTHYYISRYSFKHPHLFLDTWGRPVFTIMSSPFSQFGFQGLKMFNVLLGCLSAFLGFLTARKIGIAKAWIAILFVIFTPIYFLMTMTGLTEIQFGFILLLSVYLFFDEKYIASAVIISFIPMSRSEGFVFLPLFLLAFLMKKKFKPIPFLITGLVFFSLIGYFYIWKDFFWIFTHFPYPMHHPLYKEKGNLFYFIISSPQIFGLPLLILFLAGTGLYGYLFFKSKKEDRLKVFLEIWLLVIPVLLFFALHSVLYWKALFGSMGFVRVVTGVLPLAAIVSLKAYDYLEKKYFKKEIFRKVLLAVLIVLLLISNFPTGRYPVRFLPREQAIKKTAGWLKQVSLNHNIILYTHFYVPYLLNLDPYNNAQCVQLFNKKWLNFYPENTVVIWDSYFGPNECNFPVDFLEKSRVYKLVNIFRSTSDQNSWDDKSFEIRVYIKVPYGSHFDNNAIRDSINSKFNEARVVKFHSGTTFEKNLKKKADPHASGRRI